MSAIDAQCPSNSTFLACNYGTRFLGCCLSTLSSNEVCGTGCPTSSLTPLSFEKQYYNQVTSGTCANSEGKWYTCPDVDPPFLGCCKSNPCQPGGCPAASLVAASLSEDQAQQAAYAPLIEGPYLISTGGALSTTKTVFPTASSGSSAGASTVTSPLSPTIASPSATATSNQTSRTQWTSRMVGAVIGGLIGGLLISCAVAALFIFYKRRKTKQWRGHSRKGSIDIIHDSHMSC